MRIRTILATAVGFWLAMTSRAAVLPGDAVVSGRTIGEWAVECWNWIYSIPIRENPQLDCDGRSANVRQPDPDVHFIAPLNGWTPPCERWLTVPEGKFILVPVLAVSIDNIDTVPPLSIEEMYDAVDSVLDPPADLHAFLNGVPIPNLIDHRATSPPFSYFFPDGDHSLSFFYERPIVGLLDPIVFDGYWLMLEPLGLGEHLLQVGGELSIPIQIPQNLTCHLKVVPNPYADASATRLRVISPDNIVATVLLDGSRSLDTDHDPLTFLWMENGMAIGTNAVAESVLPVGLHSIDLIVSEGKASDTNSIVIRVVTAGEAADELIVSVKRAGLPLKETQPLTAVLMSAQRAFNRSHFDQGAHQLGVFNAKVTRQVAPANPTVAMNLLEASGEILHAVQRGE